ncbi:MAG: hypothetical protein GF307_04745 [candidate division Zixibacteria bacterium]|nr:hypothetical protein [candidate division Zixibacteria bacterium]
MRKTAVGLLVLLMLTAGATAYGYQSLQEVYDNAGPGGEYEKYITLDPDVDYEGDLFIPYNVTVRIIGNGARIFGSNGQTSIIVFNNSKLDISGCVFIGGGYGICYRNFAGGEAYCNTITAMDTAGIYTQTKDNDNPREIYSNIITDCRYGIITIENNIPFYIGYNIIHDIYFYNYAQYCPG